jgi:hypothetical protein
MPGCAIAAFRMNKPTIIIYGGTIQAGVRHVDCPALGFKKGDPVNIGEAFESYGLSFPGPWVLKKGPQLTGCRCVRNWENLRRGAFGCYPPCLPRVWCLRWNVHVRGPSHRLQLRILNVGAPVPTPWEPPSKFWVWPFRILLESPLSTLVGRFRLPGRSLNSIFLRKSSGESQSCQIFEKFDGAWSQAKVCLIGTVTVAPQLIPMLFRDIVTRQSFLNAIAVINVIGGSTNAVCNDILLVRTLGFDEHIGFASPCDG